MAEKLTARQRAQKLLKAQRESDKCLTDPEYHPDPRVAARALDGDLMKKRGETPPWEVVEAEDGQPSIVQTDGT